MSRKLTDMERNWLADLGTTQGKFVEAETDVSALHYINQAINLWSQLRGFYLAKIEPANGEGK